MNLLIEQLENNREQKAELLREVYKEILTKRKELLELERKARQLSGETVELTPPHETGIHD